MSPDFFVMINNTFVKAVNIFFCLNSKQNIWEWSLKYHLIICLCLFLVDLCFIKLFFIFSWLLKDNIVIFISTTISVALETPSLQHPIQSCTILPLPTLYSSPEFQVHSLLSSIEPLEPWMTLYLPQCPITLFFFASIAKVKKLDMAYSFYVIVRFFQSYVRDLLYILP